MYLQWRVLERSEHKESHQVMVRFDKEALQNPPYAYSKPFGYNIGILKLLNGWAAEN